ncbi:hypothetical protein [Selenomonas ruminantium]|nr:hypothetical protein [Selenomonas ruminantium]
MKIIMDRLGTEAETDEYKEKRDEIESLGNFFSGESITRMFMIIGVLLLLFDCVGFFLTYQYVELRPWQLVVFCLSIAALFIDAGRDVYRYRDLKSEDADVSAILVESFDDVKSAWNYVTMLAVSGKLLLAVLLVLWTVF